jgi:hypothetical protein
VVCPTCHQGIKPSRSWTWIAPRELFGTGECSHGHCTICPVGLAVPERAGLLWIGEKFYPTTGEFLTEANAMGISRRLPAIPRGFEIGKDWVFLAHRFAMTTPCECILPGTDVKGQKACKECKGKGFLGTPGIFSVFRPTVWEKVVDENTPEEECQALRDRGIEPVIVRRKDETNTQKEHE